VLRKTASDGEFAGELPEVTNEAHSQSAKDSEHSVDEAQPGSQGPAKDRESDPQIEVEVELPWEASQPEPAADTALSDVALATAENAELPAAASAQVGAAARAELAAAENDASAISAGTDEAAEIGAAARGIIAPVAAVSGESAKRGEPLTAAGPVGPIEPARALDFAEADRFAASIRPSWSDAPPVPVVSRPPVQVRGAAAASGARVIRHNTRTDLNVPLRKRRGSAYAILGASLLGVFGLLYLGVTSSTLDKDSRARGLSAQRAKSKSAEPSETSVQAAQRAEPAPSAQPEPQPSAAQPSAPVPTGEPAPEAIEPPVGEPELKQPDPVAEEPRDPGAALAAPGEPSAAQEPAPEPAAPQVAAAAEPPIAAPPPAAAAVNAQPQAAAAALAAAPSSPAASANEKAPQPSAAAAPAVAAQKVEPVRAADQGKVLLNLAAYPPNTRLRLDGVLVGNPYRVRVPKSSKHRIDAAAPGYAPESHVLRMDADVQLMMSLKRDQVKDVKADPYRDQRRNTAAASVGAPAQKRDRGAGFVAENPY
jgi:hypothetical protein